MFLPKRTVIYPNVNEADQSINKYTKTLRFPTANRSSLSEVARLVESAGASANVHSVLNQLVEAVDGIELCPPLDG